MSLVKVTNLSFTYPNQSRPALKNISLTVPQNSYVTIIGENGSGKSTLARLIGAINLPQNGRVSIDDLLLDKAHLNAIRAKIGMVFQNPDSQFVGSTVEDDVAFGLENHCFPPEEMNEIITKYLKLVGMNDYRFRTPESLSGGQKQRVAIASALAYRPKLLIFDEATSMLDPQGRQEISKLIQNLKLKQLATIISVTHNLSEALVSDYVYILNHGEIQGRGTPAEIFANQELITKNHLKLPFTLELIQQLKKAGFSFENEQLSTTELVQYLWTLNSIT